MAMAAMNLPRADAQGIRRAVPDSLAGLTADVSGIIGFSGDVMGSVVLSFAKDTAMKLVSAFAGKERIFAAYEHAIRERYRFFSYGDAMLLWPQAAPAGDAA